MTGQKTRAGGRILEILVAVFLYAPIIVMIVFSFNNSQSRTNFTGFSFEWYAKLLEDDLVLSSLRTTLILAVISSLVATVVGTLSAIGLYQMRSRTRKALLTVNNIPVINPDIITGVSLMLVFMIFISWLRALGIHTELGFGTLLIAHITFNIPYVILSVMPKLRQLSKNTYEAALDLGATPFFAYRKVILPEIMPGIVSGAVIALTMSIDDFMISYFTTGLSAQTLPMTIYAMTRKRIPPEINALSTLMFVGVLFLLIVINVLSARDQKKQSQRR